MKKEFLIGIAFSALLLSGCNSTNQPSSSYVPPEEFVNVFLLCGQSNMEGNTNKSGLEAAFTTFGYEDYADTVAVGIPQVRTTYMGVGYGQLKTDGSSLHASNTESKLEPKFLDTKVGMGKDDNCFGPELGCAYKLMKEEGATEEKPVYFVKSSFSGSGFAQSGTNWNWDVTKENGLYQDFTKAYLQKSLAAIQEEVGEDIHVRLTGFLWHQGESDSDATKNQDAEKTKSKIDLYKERLGNLIEAVRTDFAEYAKDGDGSNIAFIDGCINDGDNTSWGKETSVALNKVKLDWAESDEDPLHFCVKSCTKACTDGVTLGLGSDKMHYSAEGEFKLGEMYADIILENNLLDL